MSTTRIPKALQRLVEKKARNRCGYCLSSAVITGVKLAIDHVIPEAMGGQTVEGNLWLACRECNEHKGARVKARDPSTGLDAPLFNPCQQRWGDHFVWTPEGDRIRGLTATGRATVEALKLNREILVEARTGWVLVGWHPPSD